MTPPLMLDPVQVAPRTTLLGSWMPVPGFGLLPCNAYLIEAAQPVLVDTGFAGVGDAFMAALEQAIDLDDLRWIWVTHMDADHIGNLPAVLARAPKARVVTNYLGMGKMGLLGLPQERAWLINPGQRLDVGDRELLALAPPTYDAPETTGLFDTRSRALFCVDSFGTVQSTVTERAEQIDPEELQKGMALWTSIDAPWLRHVDADALRQTLRRVEDLRPEVVLGSHLQPARGITQQLAQALMNARQAPAFVGPDQRALEQMMAQAAAPVAEPAYL